MRYFIDTNIILFLFNSRDELERNVLEILNDAENEFVISSESVREILMLVKNGKINFKKLRSYVGIMSVLEEHGVDVHYVDRNSLKKLSDLEPAPSHSDPADLMIIAHAMTENLPIISSDTKFIFYKKQGLKLIHNSRSKR